MARAVRMSGVYSRRAWETRFSHVSAGSTSTLSNRAGWFRVSRPRKRETRRRTGELYSLLAAGVAPREALDRSQVDPVRAFELACHPDFQQLIATLKVAA